MNTPVHLLVGSVALDSPEEVSAAVGKLLGPRLKRVPDVEPGGRRMWVRPPFRGTGLRARPGFVPGLPGRPPGRDLARFRALPGLPA
jgi:hypothetical protein